MVDTNDLKTRVYLSGVSRMVLAHRLGLSYAAFSQRLTGYVRWHHDEQRQLERLLEEIESAKANDSDRELEYYKK
jgi:hypothetical protein